MTDKDFLEERIRQAKKMLEYLVREYEGADKETLIDMLLDSINDARDRLKKL